MPLGKCRGLLYTAVADYRLGMAGKTGLTAVRRWPTHLRALLLLLVLVVVAFVAFSFYPTHAGDDCGDPGYANPPACPDPTHELGLIDFGLAVIALLLLALLVVRVLRWQREAREESGVVTV